MPADRQYNALYNGNISSMMFSMPLRFFPHLYNYKYDQLNRLVSMDVSRNFSSDENHWQNMVSTDLHMEKYSYDGNGNIKTVLRNGNLSANPLMDSLTYFYTGGTNRLDHIRDQYFESTAHNSNYIPRIDLKDQAAGSYTYDAIGNLKSSAWMGDDLIKWNIYGKTVEVEKRALSGSTSRFIHYYYDPSGNKVGETVRHGSGGSAYYNHRWYVRDAQGNTLATYEVNNAASASAGTLKLKEYHLYGSSRLGIINRDQDADAAKLTPVDEDNLGDTYLLNFTRGNKHFEVTNHLGNVVMVLADLREGVANTGDPSLVRVYRSVMVYASDYTPFGRTMAGRVYNSPWNYRYGFNGKEYDNEVQAGGNLLDYGNRLYDPMVGRFWSVDPLTRKFAMLTPYQYGSNNPIWNIDLDGLEGVTFQDVWNGKASAVDWINNPNAWKAGLDNISSVNPFWLGYVRSYEVVTGKDYNTGDTKSRLSSAIEGAGDVMFALTLGRFLKIPNASTPFEMQMSQTAKASGQPLATPAQQAVKTLEEKSMSKLSTPVQQAPTGGVTAYETALAGGKHSGFLKNYIGRNADEINTAINSMQTGKQGINVHLDKLANPTKYVPDWNTLRPGHQQSLIKGWQNTVTKHTEQIQILKTILGN